jgi:hypothetical protein
MRRLGPDFLLLSVFLIVARADAKELTSPKNFKLTYPDEWTVPTTEESKDANENTRQLVAGAPDQAASVFAPKEEKFTPNVNVNVVPLSLPLDDQTAKQLVKETENSLDRAGFKMRAVKTSRIKVDKTESLSVAMEGSAPGVNDPMREWLVVVPGRTQTYIVTCSALKAQWADTAPTFDTIIKSLRVDVNGFKGGTLKCPKGFSLKYPDDWGVASADQLAAFPANPKPEAMILGRPEQGGAAPNITVIVTPGKLPVDKANEDSTKEFVKSVEAGLAKNGLKVSNVKTSWIRVGKLPALSLNYELTLPPPGKTVHQWQVVIPGKQQEYIVTCTAAMPQWAKAAKAFKTMVNSLKIDLEEPK